MKYWSLKNDKIDPVLVLSDPDMKIGIRIAKLGVFPRGVHSLFSELPKEKLSFQLMDNDFKLTNKAWDLIVWGGWMHIFSTRAMKLIVGLGGEEKDFFRINIENYSRAAFIYLPTDAVDAVDFEKSEFETEIEFEGKPNVPCLIQKLVFNKNVFVELLPPCFYASLLGHKQVLSDLFVNDALKSAWEASGFLGAGFQDLS